MRHLKKGRKFDRVRNQRRALLRGLAHSFLAHGRIQTTEAKAKELRPFVEHLITHAKTDTVAKKRLAARVVSPGIVKKLFETGKRFGDVRGGYTRIIKMGQRRSDGAKMAIIELVR